MMKSLLALPAFLFLLFPAVFGLLGEKPWKNLLLNSGYCAVGLFCLSLILSPLVKHFPNAQFFKKINRYRREIGISVFLYATFHFASYIFRSFEKKGCFEFKYLMHPVIAPALIAFLIFALLALTSNNKSVTLLSYKRWKNLHRTVYLSEALIFLHIFLQSIPLAFSIFLPLIFIQLFRIPSRKKLTP